MTRRIKVEDGPTGPGVHVKDAILIEKEHARACELCGKFAELCPYGPKGENVCFECGMKDEHAAIRAFAQRLSGD